MFIKRLSEKTPEAHCLWRFSDRKNVSRKGIIVRSFLNSIILTGTSTVLGVLFSAMTAFVIARKKTKGAKRLYNFFLVGMVAPLQIITTFAVLRVLNLSGTFGGLIMVYIAINLLFNILLFSSFISNIPQELDEAAFVDGCSVYRFFYDNTSASQTSSGYQYRDICHECLE